MSHRQLQKIRTQATADRRLLQEKSSQERQTIGLQQDFSQAQLGATINFQREQTDANNEFGRFVLGRVDTNALNPTLTTTLQRRGQQVDLDNSVRQSNNNTTRQTQLDITNLGTTQAGRRYSLALQQQANAIRISNRIQSQRENQALFNHIQAGQGVDLQLYSLQNERRRDNFSALRDSREQDNVSRVLDRIYNNSDTEFYNPGVTRQLQDQIFSTTDGYTPAQRREIQDDVATFARNRGASNFLQSQGALSQFHVNQSYNPVTGSSNVLRYNPVGIQPFVRTTDATSDNPQGYRAL